MRADYNPICGFAALALVIPPFWAGAAEPFKLNVSQQYIPEAGLVTNCLLVTAREKYSFLPPANWRIESDETARKISLVLADGTVIAIQIKESALGTAAGQTQVQLRDQVLARFPGSSILAESVYFAEAGAGQAFDLEWNTGNGTRFATRFAVFSVSGETIEVVLTAKPEKFQSHHATFTGLLNTFRIAPAGQR